MKDKRRSTILFRLAQHLMMTKWRDANGEPKLYLFGQLKAIAREWMEHHLVCKGGTYPAQLSYLALADLACERITAAIMENYSEERHVVPLLDPYNPEGTTRIVNFTTSKLLRWKTSPEKCHINWVICDSNWEAEFCRAVEGHSRVHSYVKNHSLGFEVPYRMGSSARKYRPDFIVRVDDGRGPDDLLNLVVEIKGRRGEDAKEKASALRHYWVPSINRHGGYGRWAAAEFTDVYAIEADFAATIDAHLAELIAAAIANSC